MESNLNATDLNFNVLFFFSRTELDVGVWGFIGIVPDVLKFGGSCKRVSNK